jgi:hypothetical protein
MAAKDRMKKRRQRINKNGGKTLSVLIDKETVAQLNQLKSHFQESQASLVARAIKNLHATEQIPVFQAQANVQIEDADQKDDVSLKERDAKPNSDELLLRVILGD